MTIAVQQPQIWFFNSLNFVGSGVSTIALILSDVGWSPDTSILCPRYSTLCCINLHLSKQTLIPLLWRCQSTTSRFRICSYVVKVTNCALHALQNLIHSSLKNRRHTGHPKGSLIYQYKPLWVLIIRNSWDFHPLSIVASSLSLQKPFHTSQGCKQV